VSDPWADPSTPTQPGLPYAGPPPTAPQPWGPYPTPPGYGWPPGYPGYPPPGGYPPPWAFPPPRPRKPGQVIGAAVLAFVQAALALIGTLYTYLFASVLDVFAAETDLSDAGARSLAAEGQVLALVQLLSVVPLIAGGILVLTRRSRAAWWVTVGGFAVQVLLTVYWLLRLTGGLGAGLGVGDTGPLISFTLFFLAAPAVGLGLLTIGAGRRWLTDGPQA
jgi:hypothetical protein